MRSKGLLHSWKSPYAKIAELFIRYWNGYGGASAVVKSPYLHAALLVTLLSFSIWTDKGWWESPMSVLPNLIGFTLGGYAILISFGDEKFKDLITGASKSGDASPFMVVNSTFVHFLLVQLAAVIIALIAKSRPISSLPEDWVAYAYLAAPWLAPVRYWGGIVFWFLGYLIFIYAIFSAVAATFGIFRMAGWYEKSKSPSSSEPIRQDGNATLNPEKSTQKKPDGDGREKPDSGTQH